MASAFVLIRAGTGEYMDFAKSAKEEIGKIKGVKEVYFVFGRYDLVAHMEAPTLEELARIISDKIRGVAGGAVNGNTHNRLLNSESEPIAL